MNAHAYGEVLGMDSQGLSGTGAGWILRVQIDLEWEEGAFGSRVEAESYYEELVKDYGNRIRIAELVTPSGDTEELTRSSAQPNIE
jgi:hypothetical protein